LTISRILAAILLFWPIAAGAQGPETLRLAYLQRADDPAYAQMRAYTGLRLRQRHRPIDGAKLALKDAAIIGRAAGLKFELVERELAPGESAAEAIRALEAAGTSTFILDLPDAEIAAAGKAFAASDRLILFNVRHAVDNLRGPDCSPVLFHTVPSAAMLSDGLAQYLASMGWRNVLILAGEGEEDRALAASFRRSAAKFGLAVTAEQTFVLTNDPRQREKSNVRLMTGGDYDVVFVADSEGEFARHVPYSTLLPRPVVGSEGLEPSAWHWTWERHGAPQLNQRFEKLARRQMAGEDWAAWAAVRGTVDAAVKSRSADPQRVLSTLRSAEFGIDMYKIGPGSFRRWDNQLRQPILLHTQNAVIAAAPLEGYLHQRHKFDSLGTDEPETDCVLTR
jgi:ABC transporter substrate binding protein (PQQ-dependent alcohol dehydrogenase system)